MRGFALSSKSLAWSGDKAASVHVGNIVGIHDPNLNKTDMKVTFTKKDKCSKAVNNWGLLTVGLLNREYQCMEAAVAATQRAYLNQRQDFLEEQLIHHRDLRAREPLGLKRPMSTTTERVKSAGPERRDRVHSATVNRSRAPVKPLLQQHDTVVQSDLTLADLVIEPSTAENNKVLSSLYRLTSSHSCGDINASDNHDPYFYATDEDRAYVAYDDPRRYSLSGTYSANQIVGEKWSKSRPVSGVHQKRSDSMRSRPKSAVLVTKGERPLKYESTRPISAAVKSSKSKDRLPNRSNKDANNQDSEKKPTMIRVNVTKPEFVAEYEEDVRKLTDMEDDFKKTALMLQKKLGINEAGTVY